MERYSTTKYDGDMDVIPGLKYRPWIGCDYSNGFESKRILVIAESVYDWDEGSDMSSRMLASPDFGRRVVHEHGLHFTTDRGIYNSPTYRNIERVIFGEKNVSSDKLELFWSSISLHQYVQRPMKSIKERPNNYDYTNGFDVLKNVITLINPDLCILLGTDFNKIRPMMTALSKGTYEEFSKINGAIPKTFCLDIQDQEYKVIAIKHPGMRFSWNIWHELYFSNKIGVVES